MTARLERRYRRLLWAYPKAYRDHRGAEMVTTMLDLAEAGDGRPRFRLRAGDGGPGFRLSARDGRPGFRLSGHLILAGLRQRFRLPARRPLAWLGALLAAVALGAFGAAGGTWLGWQTAASIPSDGSLRALNAAMTGMPAPAAVYTDLSAMKGPGTLVRADGTSDYSASRVRAALTSAGWRITSFREEDGAIVVDDIFSGPHIPAKLAYYTATKGGLKLQGDGTVITGGADRGLAGQASYGTEVWPREPAVVRPLTIAGLVAGALAGWLLAAAAAARMRRSGRRRRWLASALSAAGFVAIAVPAYQHYRDTYQVMVYAHGSPYPYIVDGPRDAGLTLICTVIGLLAIVVAVASTPPRRTPAPLIAVADSD